MKENGFVSRTRKLCYGINKIAIYIQIVCILFMSVMVFADVSLRFLFAKPISGCAELVGFLMTMVGFMGLGICTLDRSHLNIDIFVGRLSPKAQAINDMINSVLVVAIGAIMAYAGFRQGMTVLGYGTKATLTNIYVYPFYWLMALGYVLLCLAALSNLLEGACSLKKIGKACKQS